MQKRQFYLDRDKGKLKVMRSSVIGLLLSAITVSVHADEVMIRLHNQSFDPLVSTSKTGKQSSDFSARSENDVQAASLHIVQFYQTPVSADQQQLKNLGAIIRTSLADHALIVLMDDAVKLQVEALKSVRWVGVFSSQYKLEEGLLPTANDGLARQLLSIEPIKYFIMLFEKGKHVQNRVAERIRQLGGQVSLTTIGRRMEATFDQTVLEQIVEMPEVSFIERWTPDEDDMDLVRQLNGANYIENTAGYTGQGVRGEVSDDGLRTSHRDFQFKKPLIHKGNDPDNNHGTSVYGVVFGSGASNAKARGMLPAAEPIFSSRYSMRDRTAHTAELVDPDGRYRAVFQTASWGGGRTRRYTSVSAELDEIIFDYDILITQSQSNAGNQDSRPQAWAKNIVSIGGIQGFDTARRSDDRWGRKASIGPARDGRIKPDLSQFYGSMFTTSSTSDSAHSQFGGTSGATPAAAGHFGILFQMWADGVFAGGPGQNRDVFDSRPHASTAKALMINMAYQYDFNGTNHDKTRTHQGWGFPDVKNLYDTAKASSWVLPVLVDESDLLQSTQPADSNSYSVVSDGSSPLKATMVYSDPPGNPFSAVHRINDLTLKATSPTGTIYWGNHGLRASNWSTPDGEANTVDTVENIFIKNPAAGSWTIEVIGSEIVQDSHIETAGIIDADYALVVTGGVAGVIPPATFNRDPISKVDAEQGKAYSASLAGEANGSNLSFSKVSGPAWLAVANSGALSGSPSATDIGLNSFVVRVDDGEANDETTLIITVIDAVVVPGLPVVTVAASDAQAAEAGRDPGALTFSRSGNTASILRLRYTLSGSATNGTDYDKKSGTVRIRAGQRSRTISIKPKDDTAVEGDENVIVALSTNAAYEIGAAGEASVTISDNDTGGGNQPVVTVVASDASASEAGRDPGTLTFSRTGATRSTLALRYTLSGSATNGTDYDKKSGIVRIRAGQSSRSITIKPKDDTAVEGDENVTVTLSTNTAYEVGAASEASVTISDNDTGGGSNLPEVSISFVQDAREAGTRHGRVRLERTGPINRALTVHYSDTGSAQSGTDYKALTGSKVIKANKRSVTFDIVPINDIQSEDTETVILTLEPNIAYRTANEDSATVKIIDND